MINRKIDIIYFTLFRWNNPYSSVSFSFAKEFILNNRVFYVNHPISYKDYLTGLNDREVKDIKGELLKGKPIFQHLDGLSKNFVSVTPPMTMPTNWMSEGKMYDRYYQKNNEKIKETLRKTIEKYNIKDYILLNCYDPFFIDFIPEEHPPLLSVYQCIDDIAENDYTRKHGVRMEQKAAAKADITTVTSTELRNILSKHSDHTHIVHNAADIDNFTKAVTQKYERPEEIKDIKTKIIGFTGNMDAVRINYPLLKKMAESHSDKTLMLVGPINNTEYKEIGLDQLPNVVFTGSKDITDLPRYLQYSDCVIIPFLCNKLTKSIYPLKINEYLAAGKAVVSTAFSKDIRTFEDQIFLAENEEDFVNVIDEAIASNTQENIQARQDLAGTNTWTARVEQLWQIIENHQKTKKSENVKQTTTQEVK